LHYGLQSTYQPEIVAREEDIMHRVTSFLSGFIIGGLIGGALGLLLTPASGDHLRQQMRDRAQKFQIEIKNAATTRRAELEQELAALRQPRKV
jgi:gas vesicle protein